MAEGLEGGGLDGATVVVGATVVGGAVVGGAVVGGVVVGGVVVGALVVGGVTNVAAHLREPLVALAAEYERELPEQFTAIVRPPVRFMDDAAKAPVSVSVRMAPDTTPPITNTALRVDKVGLPVVVRIGVPNG